MGHGHAAGPRLSFPCGAAFGLQWHTKPWHYTGDISDLACTTPWHEPIYRAFRSVGYECEVLLKQGAPGEEDLFRARVVEAIRDHRRPVLAAGVVGPPACSIVTGYDDGGEVLTGWSLFQSFAGHDPASDFEPSGYYRKRAWFPDTWSLILMGERRDPAPASVLDREALEWAAAVMCQDLVMERHNGLASYGAWSDSMARDEDFPADRLDVLMERLDCHFAATMVLAEGRWHGAQFLKRMAEREPRMRSPLLRAAEHVLAAHRCGMRLLEVQGETNPHDEGVARRLAEPETRRRVVELIREAREEDARAVDRIGEALR